MFLEKSGAWSCFLRVEEKRPGWWNSMLCCKKPPLPLLPDCKAHSALWQEGQIGPDTGIILELDAFCLVVCTQSNAMISASCSCMWVAVYRGSGKGQYYTDSSFCPAPAGCSTAPGFAEVGTVLLGCRWLVWNTREEELNYKATFSFL